MRAYQPIWNRIKNKNTASIVTHPDSVARIIKAVKKEKSADKGFALMLSSKALVARLKITKEFSEVNNSVTLHFSLITKIKETYIEVDNL